MKALNSKLSVAASHVVCDLGTVWQKNAARQSTMWPQYGNECMDTDGVAVLKYQYMVSTIIGRVRTVALTLTLPLTHPAVLRLSRHVHPLSRSASVRPHSLGLFHRSLDSKPEEQRTETMDGQQHTLIV